MSETDKRIKAAAAELSAALTEGGEDYTVTVYKEEVTQIQDRQRRYAHTVFVSVVREDRVAP